MTSFIFMRHGQSRDNENDVVSTADTPLTKEGRANARKAAQVLKNTGITAIACSPYPRARETANIVAGQLGIAKERVIVIDELRERSLGDLEGKPHQHPREWYFTIDGQDGVEPVADMIARSKIALQKISQIGSQGEVLVVGHVMDGYYLSQVAAGKQQLQDFDPPTVWNNAALIEITVHPASVPKIVLPVTRNQAAMLGGLILFVLVAAAVWLLWPKAPQSSAPINSTPIPIDFDDLSESPNIQDAVQKQLHGSQNNNSLQPQAQNPLQPTAPNLQSPQ